MTILEREVLEELEQDSAEAKKVRKMLQNMLVHLCEINNIEECAAEECATQASRLPDRQLAALYSDSPHDFDGWGNPLLVEYAKGLLEAQGFIINYGGGV